MTTFQDNAVVNEVAAFTMKVARPLYWHDVKIPFPKYLDGGSCFMLRFNRRLVGVTANHVIEAFESARRRTDSIFSFLRTNPLEIKIIDSDKELDIATFEVTEEQLIASKGVAIDCRDGWPPPSPDIGREISFGGFPELLREPWRIDGGEFRAFVHTTMIEDITDRSIIATYVPNRDRRIVAAPKIRDRAGTNWSGCSGGPVLMHVERGGFHRWFPVGMMLGGPRRPRDDTMRAVRDDAAQTIPDGCLLDLETFILARIHRLNADGFIEHPSMGWLP